MKKVTLSEWHKFEDGIYQKRAYIKSDKLKTVLNFITIKKVNSTSKRDEYEIFMSDTLDRWRVGLVEGIEKAKSYGDKYLAQHFTPDLHN
mgnify:CR=1 FL=1